jgi:hypothetical protein
MGALGVLQVHIVVGDAGNDESLNVRPHERRVAAANRSASS